MTDAYDLAIWRRLKDKILWLRVATAKFSVVKHVRISKQKNRFVKAAEHNFSTEIFSIVKAIHRRPRVVYEVEDLNGTPIDVQFYQEELTPVRITRRRTYKIKCRKESQTRHSVSSRPLGRLQSGL